MTTISAPPSGQRGLAWRPLDFLVLAVIVAAGLVVLLSRLGAGSLFDWDEATYAEIAREIYVFHDWLHLHWNYAPWFNKPPLYIWLTAVLFHFGVNEFLARLVSALSGVGLLVLTYAIGRRLYGRLIGALAAGVLLACREFVAAGRFGTSDELLSFWLYACLLAALLALDRDRRWWLVAGGCLGLALMTKGFAALPLPASLLIALFMEGRAGELRRPWPWAGLGLALLLALPWHLAMLAWQGPAFVAQYFGQMVAERALHPLEGHTGGLLYYAIQLRTQFFPWAYLVPFAYLYSIRRRPTGAGVLLAWPAVVFVLYSLVQSKVFWYLLPVYPALAILVAALFAAALQGSLLARAGLFVGLVLGVAWVPASVAAAPLGLLVGLATVALGIWVVTRRRSAAPAWAPTITAGLFCCALSAAAIAPQYQLQTSPVVYIAHQAAARPGSPGRLVLFIGNRQRYSDDDVSHSLLFYSHRRVATAAGIAALRAMVACGADQDTVFKTAYTPLLRQSLGLQVRAVGGPWTYAGVRQKAC